MLIWHNFWPNLSSLVYNCLIKVESGSLTLLSRDVKFGIQIGSDRWPHMGQIWDFLRSVSLHFGSVEFISLTISVSLKASRVFPDTISKHDQPDVFCEFSTKTRFIKLEINKQTVRLNQHLMTLMGAFSNIFPLSILIL